VTKASKTAQDSGTNLAERAGYLIEVAARAPSVHNISLGHPLGATGAILVVKALYELRRTGGRYALVTMCIGGGQGIAAVFERI
jgi:Thiolase, C-terminal domain